MRARGDLRHHAAVAAVLAPTAHARRWRGCGRGRRRARARRPPPSRRSSSRCRARACRASSAVCSCHGRVVWHWRRGYGGHKLATRGVRHRLAPEDRPLQATTIRIGTRGSPLALAQAREVQARLAGRAWARRACASRCASSRPRGDRIQDRPLAEVGGKGLFTKEIEEALLAGEIDLAVHSMKDMPTLLPAGSTIACLPAARGPARRLHQRARPQRLPICRRARWSAPPRCAARRRCGDLRPDLQVVPLRGNVETRLRKLAGGRRRATLLAWPA